MNAIIICVANTGIHYTSYMEVSQDAVMLEMAKEAHPKKVQCRN
jgi:hypothetical protein